MELFRNFVNQMYECVPFATKVLKVSEFIKSYQEDIKKDKIFLQKFIQVLKMFVGHQIELNDMCTIMEAADGYNKLSDNQIQYLCEKIYDNYHVMRILNTFVEDKHLDDQDIHSIANFLVLEINNSVHYK
ncbi:hypothetical protein [Perigonia lusca single nucleopolyhedrovirus]|uniref:Ac75-like protein n=1 Tax=Perigonia lusca single nucleopolyhedrovirus TaxID=1675865 RepID=A0A0M3N065_9ABAC|nr:hypothetical protein [Perigonia lusca single nucleopolyhedrovirus]AKN80649.1 hypothetical protein [Perigonia lusca single nucleopolyhedrovirus]